ncbi:MAG: metallophosphoesterase family protein [Candidatus Nanohaloarchaea archaeon]|nr:metallophosphoesterase family protein [Candidatus Nanohaloarchaea archaeon]
MRLGIISDIHANLPALEQVLDRLDEEDLDGLLCAGDIVGYYVWPNEVVEAVRERDVDAVLGNHDAGLIGRDFPFNAVARQALDWTEEEITDANRSYLEGLPDTHRDDYDGTDLYMVHGSPRSPLREYVNGSSIGPPFIESCFDEPPDICVMGHTHHPYTTTVEETLFLNPGSVGQPRDGDTRASCAVLDTEEREAAIHRVEYDIKKVAEAVREHLPSTLGERLHHGI